MGPRRFGAALNAIRIERGLTARQLSRLSGVHWVVIVNAENEKRPPPPRTTVNNLERALGVPLDSLAALAVRDRLRWELQKVANREALTLRGIYALVARIAADEAVSRFET